MDNFELIDRFLDNDLSQQDLAEFERRLEDDSFQDDLKFYEILKKGVYGLERTRLRNRLDTYYDKYSQGQGEPKSLTWVWVSGIAASLALVTYLFIIPLVDRDKPVAEQPPVEETVDPPMETDPAEHQPEVAEVEPDESELLEDPATEAPEEALALGGLATVPASQVKSLQYPQEISYTFNNGMLRLFGDPLIPALSLDVIKVGEAYYLNYYDDSYRLSSTEEPRALGTPESSQVSGTNSSSETIQVAFEPLFKSAQSMKGLIVRVRDQLGPYQFVYLSDEELTISGNFSLSEIECYQLNFEGQEYGVVKHGEQLHLLVGKPGTLTDMVTAGSVDRDISSLFFDRSNLNLKVQIP